MTRRGLRTTLAAALLEVAGATGCLGPDHPVAPCPEADGAFACVLGATLAAPPGGCEFPITDVEGVADRTRRALELAGQVWGVEPDGYVAGWVVEYCESWFACRTGGAAAWTYGCAYPGSRTIWAAPGFSGCLEGVLVHEVGHLVVGDPDHRDPRFDEANALEAAPCEDPRPATL